MTDPVITNEIIIVFALLGLVILIFVFDWLRVDLVGILMMALLPLTGVLTGEEAIMGLGSNAVVSIIAVMIIGAGLNRTGVQGREAPGVSGSAEVTRWPNSPGEKGVP